MAALASLSYGARRRGPGGLGRRGAAHSRPRPCQWRFEFKFAEKMNSDSCRKYYYLRHGAQRRPTGIRPAQGPTSISGLGIRSDPVPGCLFLEENEPPAHNLDSSINGLNRKY